jgi:hypothetical protein
MRSAASSPSLLAPIRGMLHLLAKALHGPDR